MLSTAKIQIVLFTLATAGALIFLFLFEQQNQEVAEGGRPLEYVRIGPIEPRMDGYFKGDWGFGDFLRLEDTITTQLQRHGRFKIVARADTVLETLLEEQSINAFERSDEASISDKMIRSISDRVLSGDKEETEKRKEDASETSTGGSSEENGKNIDKEETAEDSDSKVKDDKPANPSMEISIVERKRDPFTGEERSIEIRGRGRRSHEKPEDKSPFKDTQRVLEGMNSVLKESAKLDHKMPEIAKHMTAFRKQLLEEISQRKGADLFAFGQIDTLIIEASQSRNSFTEKEIIELLVEIDATIKIVNVHTSEMIRAIPIQLAKFYPVQTSLDIRRAQRIAFTEFAKKFASHLAQEVFPIRIVSFPHTEDNCIATSNAPIHARVDDRFRVIPYRDWLASHFDGGEELAAIRAEEYEVTLKNCEKGKFKEGDVLIALRNMDRPNPVAEETSIEEEAPEIAW